MPATARRLVAARPTIGAVCRGGDGGCIGTIPDLRRLRCRWALRPQSPNSAERQLLEAVAC